MFLFKLFVKESNVDIKPLLALSVVSGASNAALLATINHATTNGNDHSQDLKLLVISILCIGIFIITKKRVMEKSVLFVQDLIRKMRIRIVNKIRHSELQMLEEIGSSDVYARITKDAVHVSRSAEVISNTFQSLIMVIFSVIYVAFLSLPSFIILLIYFSLGTYSYLRLSEATNRLLTEAAKTENKFFDSLNSILYGFKELKINQKKNQSAFKRFEEVTGETKELNIQASGKFITSYLFAQSFFYILLTIIIFIVPMYYELTGEDIIKISAAILFIVGPMENLVGTIPYVMSSNVAAKNIVQLEEKLESKIPKEELERINDPKREIIPMKFEKELKIKDLSFAYGTSDFEIGPLSLEIRSGQITFISGGNGTGKSTFLKLLSGLYYPKSGQIFADEIKIHPGNYSEYRELFSVIFTDFFLFERLYGLEDIHSDEANDYLKQMGIYEKTQVIDHEITERNLSTGQKKRLALAVSLLEDKSIYVFDEVAADQDPEFKKYFYRELLLEMKNQGKTIVVVTHDDFYFDACDVHYKFRNGVLASLKTQRLTA